ncbi:A/G-specific adenine glycosylase [Paenibacillus alvei TS-15]|uniref:Adenine DNA glycosylase n=1 Tax=Paenibacillus alvei TS-15 TaxID=1117108 RepID=S9SMV4_PAEAL|nr:A/G-specific adenine glycosylase [Paenibacillus alvei]EPY05418.1 A/G-specific adenine glycosylase [Paenibacillus alvei TS-15]
MDEQKRYFSRELLLWYRANKRDLPWRRQSNPYYTWVSEIMLQQTRVETVKPYFERFIGKFPTVEALADAPEEEVLKAWEGLGYYSRARNLQTAAREVKEQYGGQVPEDKSKVSALKGIGPYTSGAIMSIAFNRPEPAVDGNVMRVLSRYFRLHDDIAKPSTRVHMEHLAQELIPEGCASDFNQALMELGALVCTPKSPSCLLCPVMEHCEGRMAGEELTLPIKTKAKPPKPELRYAALIEGAGEHEGKVLVRQRPDTGLLAKMWELPHILVPKQVGIVGMSDAESYAILHHSLQAEGVDVAPVEHWMDAEHTFSHIHWQMCVYRCNLRNLQPKDNTMYKWAGPEEMEELAFPNLFVRLLKNRFQ